MKHKIIIRDIESFFLDDVLQKVKQRKKAKKRIKKEKGEIKNG